MSRWDRVWCVTPYAALTPDVAWLSVGLGPKFYAIPQHQGCLEEGQVSKTSPICCATAVSIRRRSMSKSIYPDSPPLPCPGRGDSHEVRHHYGLSGRGLRRIPAATRLDNVKQHVRSCRFTLSIRAIYRPGGREHTQILLSKEAFMSSGSEMRQRSESVRLRLTPEEYAMIGKRAEECSMTASAFLRATAHRVVIQI